MKKLLLPVIFYLIYIICRADLNLDALLPGDLLFQVERSAYADAIADATAQDSVSYCHVGIYAVVDSLPVVVEAIPRGGSPSRLSKSLRKASSASMPYASHCPACPMQALKQLRRRSRS